MTVSEFLAADLDNNGCVRYVLLHIGLVEVKQLFLSIKLLMKIFYEEYLHFV